VNYYQISTCMVVPVYFCFGGLELQITQSHFASIFISFLLCPYLLDCLDPSIRVDTHRLVVRCPVLWKYLFWCEKNKAAYLYQPNLIVQTHGRKIELIILLWPGLESECTVNSTSTLEGAATSEHVWISKILSPQFQSVYRRCLNDISNGSCHVIIHPYFLFVFVLPHYSMLASLCRNSTIISQFIPAHTLVLSQFPDLMQRKILFSWELLGSKNL